ncbi:hypothetical protein B9Z65_2206 [Elsinoe australis]|uniref:Uncharacterized protein n=1 Tax=Elsinoe australis TaxID=40998 RepID=A0A2P7YNC2_9PEZI|nr:hypothetical protein B9Z65_2206 [Elsinoe australis]
MGRPRKRRLVSEDDQTGALQPEPESTTAHITEPVVANGDSVEAQGDPDDIGDWFEGGGIFSTLLPKVRASPWPALEEVPAVCRTALRSKDAVSSTTSVPELTESPDTASSSNGSGPQSHSVTSTPRGDPNSESPHESITLTGCACLSSMYLSLSSLQDMKDFSFPSSLHKLREAISGAWNVLHCPLCPKTFLTGFQNIQLLGMFMMSAAERYSKILTAINAETEDAISTGRKMSFRMADLQGSNSHLHTFDPNHCLGDICLDLEPHQWQLLVKKVVKGEIWGPAHACCPAFMTLSDGMIARQEKWHINRPNMDYPRPYPECMQAQQAQIDNPETKHLCLAMVYEARKIIEHMALD